MSQHESFLSTFHAAVVAFLTLDEPAIESLQTRFAQHAGTWTRAWACGYYRAAHLYPALSQSDQDFYALEAKELVGLIAPGLDIGSVPSTDVQRIMAGFDATLAYDAVDGPLTPVQINDMAHGLAMLLVANPGFREPRRRERVLQSLCNDVTEDVLGDWPTK
ncbi:hypothetical protein ASF11_04900 [Acidovorax sp. Leaf76]|uniref:hypothetical protein n=1 Tax=unclassified Acidovorax TaxID=2684926 RepID=UPI0006F3F1DA|nr:MULTISPECIES: hypothetical protein [unclassified Acidovorax]KQO21770.1 hypothetical protein ASF11_04900 [Acidovorax sp. Leaf76]KQO33964.1 hypothetical protein ASF19_24920 [Acidovorax sp. Leaf84]KQS35613.1 hypothetical protein ASG27_25190 [Acidovorax sp. Leaf191]